MKKIVLIDNYDSFTYNLYDYILQCDCECTVYKNDEISTEALTSLAFDGIVLSPGPETPKEAGITLDVISHFHTLKPILGICLGHQALGVFFGATLRRARTPMHGKTSMITFENHTLFDGVAQPAEIMRYHSLVIDDLDGTPLKVLSRALGDREIMAVAHTSLPLYGIQFHPESILTPDGLTMIRNWIKTL